MKRGILGIFDYETEYANNLMDYLNEKEHFYYEICLFTNIERLNAFLLENTFDVFLICESACNKTIDLTTIPNVFVLSEDDSLKEGDYPYIFKYQSAERIYTSIVAGIDKCTIECSRDEKKESPVNFIGVISPNGGSGKTTFSLALAQALAQSERTLYLSFESLGSFISEEKRKGDMSDVIYYMKQKQKGILMKIQSMATTIAGADCIFSVTHFEDLQAIEKDDIDYLLEEFITKQVYQTIIFDFGSINELAFYMLEHCKIIYVTQLKVEGAMCKEQAFQKLLFLEEKKYLLNKLVTLKLPWDTKIATQKYPVEQFLEGELGKFINELLHGTTK